ncbi:hypothetical protein CDL12_13664 [Handroanthus impetiginosus]|uniref:Retrotransposon gag domain-containing protein n=1 Tax=Handroanthus impetiginosus TaxID=429701 RepID=A0A2G9H881_9LAMI|nr:hypothetical protein CDL12_13664 [Handroanthus impetiginosus]
MAEDQRKEIEQPILTPPPGFGDVTLGMSEPYITPRITLLIIGTPKEPGDVIMQMTKSQLEAMFYDVQKKYLAYQCQGRAQNIAPQIVLPQPIIPRHLFPDDHKDGLKRNDRVKEEVTDSEDATKSPNVYRRPTYGDRTLHQNLDRGKALKRQRGVHEERPTRRPRLAISQELPNYDGTNDPQRHVNKFERIIRLYAVSDAQKAQIFATTLDEALARKFIYHFASKKKAKKPYTHLFSIQQKEDEPLREFIDRFNTESLMVQDLRMDLVVAILMNSLQPGSFRSKLSRSPPRSMEELMIMSEKYINEEEFSKMKD